MKQIHEIKDMDNGAVIDSITGIISEVYPPVTPSQAQADRGIHKQAVILKDQAGNRVGMNLNSASLHMDESDKNKVFRFESIKSENGQLQGLVVNKWVKDGAPRVGIDVWGQASFFATGEEGATNVVEDAAVRNADPMGGAKNYFKYYRAIYDVARESMSNTKTTSSDIKDMATHYMIGLQQRGALKDAITSFVKSEKQPVDKEAEKQVAEGELTDQPVAESPKEPVDEPEQAIPWREVKDSEGRVISEMDKDDLIDLCIKLIPFHNSENPIIKAGFEAAMRSRDEMELTYTDIYDVYEIMLNQDHEKPAIDAAYDAVNANKTEDSEVVCKRILMDQKTFVTFVENHEPAKA